MKRIFFKMLILSGLLTPVGLMAQTGDKGTPTPQPGANSNGPNYSTAGSSAISGSTGMKGSRGSSGARATTGARGSTGAHGATGGTGMKGSRGATGSSGPKTNTTGPR